MKRLSGFLFFTLFCVSCSQKATHLVEDFEPLLANGNINVVIEIPTGTNEKFEVEKTTGTLQLETLENGQPRRINYLPYPFNYGMVPRTLLPKKLGGDGDPLDVFVLGKPIEKGTVIECKLIGVLKLLDRGEQDDKLIAVSEGSIFYHINDLKTLDEEFPGVLDISKIWFINYKGKGKMQFKGFGDTSVSDHILKTSITVYKQLHKK
ncbi:MAG: inorganic diphosphatase [Winogradskyella sp.]|uniref:inorganic diphosphatase n=1 Tax=Winogradskyella sp. TaxID=1883156 RepID=UPI00385CEC93